MNLISGTDRGKTGDESESVSHELNLRSRRENWSKLYIDVNLSSVVWRITTPAGGVVDVSSHLPPGSDSAVFRTSSTQQQHDTQNQDITFYSNQGGNESFEFILECECDEETQEPTFAPLPAVVLATGKTTIVLPSLCVRVRRKNMMFPRCS